MNRIKSLREEHGMTQSELGKLLSVKDAAISKYESEKVPLTTETILRLSEIFSVSTDYLLGQTDSKFPVHELDWRYPPVSNRLGTILRKYRNIHGLSEQAFAERLGVTTDTYIGIEIGKVSPPMRLFQKISQITNYDMDYLTGAVDSIAIPTGNSIEINNVKIPTSNIESSFHFKTRFEELCLTHGITCDNVTEFLGLTNQEYIDITSNRMPTLSELLKIAYGFEVSIDYLVGKTDTPFSNLSEEERNLVLNYRDCIDSDEKKLLAVFRELSDEDRIILYGKALDLKRTSVAADEPLEKTGTDNQGK